MPATIIGKRYVKQSLSLREDQLAAVKRAAGEDGHGNFSRFVQEIIEQELRSRYGRNWSDELTPRPAEMALAS